MGYAIRITSRAVDVVSGADQTPGTIAAEATGVRTGSSLRSKFGGSQLHSRKSSLARVVRQGNGWVVENPVGGASPFGTPPASSTGSYTPAGRPPPPLGGSSQYSPYATASNFAHPSSGMNGAVGPPALVPPGVGLGINSPSFGPAVAATPGIAFPTAATAGSPYTPSTPGIPPPPSAPRTPSSHYAHFPPTPNPATGNGLGFAPPPPPGGKKDE